MTTSTAGWILFWRQDRACFVLKYMKIDGKQAHRYLPRTFTKSMRALAKKWAEEWLATQKTLRAVSPRRGSGMTVREAYHRFIGIVESNGRIAPATKKSYQTDFQAHVLREGVFDSRSSIADEPLASLIDDFPRLAQWYMQVCRRTKAYRARHVYSTMKVFFDATIFQKWVRGENPFSNASMRALQPPPPTKRESPPVVLPIETAQALVLAQTVPLSWRVRYILAFTTAKRDGELAGMTWQRLGLDAPVPFVDVEEARRLVRAKNEELGPLKTHGSARTLPLHPAAVAALKEWRDSPNGVRFILGRAPRPTDPVLPSERHGHGEHFARPASAKITRRHLAAIGLPTTGAKGKNVTMHATRKSCLTYLERAAVPERTRKIIAGHGILDVTDRFYTADRELAALAAEVAKVPLQWSEATGEEEESNEVSSQVSTEVSTDTCDGPALIPSDGRDRGS